MPLVCPSVHLAIDMYVFLSVCHLLSCLSVCLSLLYNVQLVCLSPCYPAFLSVHWSVKFSIFLLDCFVSFSGLKKQIWVCFLLNQIISTQLGFRTHKTEHFQTLKIVLLVQKVFVCSTLLQLSKQNFCIVKMYSKQNQKVCLRP